MFRHNWHLVVLIWLPKHRRLLIVRPPSCCPLSPRDSTRWADRAKNILLHCCILFSFIHSHSLYLFIFCLGNPPPTPAMVNIYRVQLWELPGRGSTHHRLVNSGVLEVVQPQWSTMYKARCVPPMKAFFLSFRIHNGYDSWPTRHYRCNRDWCFYLCFIFRCRNRPSLFLLSPFPRR